MRRIKHKIQDQFRVGTPFKKEFRRQMRLLIIVTIGFTIAFVWREAIFTAFKAIVLYIFGTQNSPVISDILTATFITLIGLIIIVITSTFLQEKPYL